MRRGHLMFQWAAVCAAAAGLSGCSDPDRARIKATTQASYDAAGKLVEITYDKNKNGKIDTWTMMDGARPVSSMLDTDEDGVVDRWEYYGPDGKLTRVEWERPPAPGPQNFKPKRTGKPDAAAYMDAAGAVARIEYFETSDVTHERVVARREFYAAGKVARAEEDTDGDGAIDRWETYDADGVLTTVEFDDVKPYDGKPDRRLTYDKSGALVKSETIGAIIK